MEVILKKTKITGSILGQTLTASLIDLEQCDVLGFCVYKNLKWMVLYKLSTNELRKYLMFREAMAETDYSSKPYFVKVKFDGGIMTKTYQARDEAESERFVKVLNGIKHRALTAGQFYL